MKLFALSDPHLAFGVPGKSMDRFGPEWIEHPRKIKRHWENLVSAEDVVAVPGDISWAKTFDAALADLRWLDSLPGHKVILKGNHDLWWPSASALEREIPASLRFVQNHHVKIGAFVFFGSRLWDTREYSVFDLIEWDSRKGPIPGLKSGMQLSEQERIYDRELVRLKLSADSIPENIPGIRIGLCHYPPLDHLLHPSRASALFAQTGAAHVLFGHLHSVKREFLGRAFGTLNGTVYHLTSCDYLDFIPKLICEA